MSNLVVLIDNEKCNPELYNQHGLSIWLETGSSNILFDAGQDGAFMQNAKALGIPLSKITHLVLSHGHYDHTGGVSALLDQGMQPTVVVGPDAWTERKSSHPIGIPWSQNILSGMQIITDRDSFEIEPGIMAVSTGGTKDASSRHPNLQRFVNGRWEPDTFPDEQILLLKTIKGLVVITGCTHCGVQTLITRVNCVSGGEHIYALIGGLHLGSSTPESIRDAARHLHDIEHIWVNHCTGPDAFDILRDILGSQVEWAGAGFRAELPPLTQ